MAKDTDDPDLANVEFCVCPVPGWVEDAKYTVRFPKAPDILEYPRAQQPRLKKSSTIRNLWQEGQPENGEVTPSKKVEKGKGRAE